MAMAFQVVLAGVAGSEKAANSAKVPIRCPSEVKKYAPYCALGLS
jgi:hypothetical protein